MPALVTPRLRLVPITLEAIEAVLDGDQPRAEALVGARFPPGWPNDPLLDVGFPYSREAIEEGSRGIGLATEATRACAEWALAEPGIAALRATTFPWHGASLGVIRNLGMRQVATRDHDTLGELLVFERRR